MDNDPVLEFMKRNRIPMTRENYLEVAYMDTPPAELDAEAECSLPEQFQLEAIEEFRMSAPDSPIKVVYRLPDIETREIIASGTRTVQESLAPFRSSHDVGISTSTYKLT